jgi:cyclic-di-AMP phosphodiesterase PgpH
MKKKKSHKQKSHRNSILWISGIIIYITFALSLMSFFYPGFSFYLGAGNIAPKMIVSPISTTIEDTEGTEEARQNAASRVDTAYKKINDVTTRFKNKHYQLFNIVEDTNWGPKYDFTTDRERAENIKSEMLSVDLKINLLDETISVLAGLNRMEFGEIKSTTDRIVFEILDVGLTEKGFEKRGELVKIKLGDSSISSVDHDALYNICIQLIDDINLVVDLEATENAKQAAMSRVKPIIMEIDENQIIVPKGEIITSEDIEIIETLGITKRFDDPKVWMIIFILPLFLLLGLYFIIYWFDPRFFSDTKKLILFAVLASVFIISSRLLVPINPFLVPIPFIAFLMSVFLGSKLTIPALLLLAPSSAIYSRIGYIESTGFIAIGIGYALFVILTCIHLDKVKRFSDFFLVAGYSIFGSLIVLVLFSLFTKDISILTMTGYALGSTAVQIALGFGFTPLLERIAHKSTVFHLLELSDLNSPLMKELMLTAPGTYQHSLLVGNIASAACEAIGADSLLARVGGYYHDIGKMKHPDFFIENQTGDNPHDEITPSMSTLIITKHVKEGLEIASKYKLPPEVTSFITSHHGTTVVKYFYHKARETDPLCRETEFRYRGEKPQTVEEAIVMIADVAESASRARKPERSKIEDLVDSIVKDRINDGQLSNCPISLSELSKVRKALTNQIASTRHERVPYPNSKELK